MASVKDFYRNKAVAESTGDLRGEWKEAAHRFRAKAALYAVDYLPSVRKHTDVDGNLGIKWKNDANVGDGVVALVEMMAGAQGDALAKRKPGAILDAQEFRKMPDPFAELWGDQSASETLKAARRS